MSVAERLVTARGKESRQSVAESVGISVSALQMYENGMRVPRDKIKILLAQHYNMTVQDLFFPLNATESGETDADP